MKFNVGDKVRALDSTSGGGTKKGNIYIVTGLYDFCGPRIKYIDDNGITEGWCVENFELVKPGKKVKVVPKDYHGIFKASCMNYVTLCDSEKLAKDYIKDNDLSDEHIIFSMKEVLRSNKVSKIRFTTIKKKGKKK